MGKRSAHFWIRYIVTKKVAFCLRNSFEAYTNNAQCLDTNRKIFRVGLSTQIHNSYQWPFSNLSSMVSEGGEICFVKLRWWSLVAAASCPTGCRCTSDRRRGSWPIDRGGRSRPWGCERAWNGGGRLRHSHLGAKPRRCAVRVTIAELPLPFVLPLGGLVDGVRVGPVHAVGRLC